jgi:RNA polymerase sigma-70 factor, ECF subfamily
MDPITNIFKSFDSSIHALICKKVNHQDYCHDILQEVYIKVMQNIDKVEKADNQRSYLLRIADNAVTDYFRNRKNKDLKELKDTETLIDKSVAIDKSIQLADCCLRPMIDQLEKNYRDALIFTELEGLTQKQFAHRVGISPANAKIRVHRARQKLKEVIINCCNYSFDKFGNVVDKQEKPSDCCGQY